jgi:hypothetical protein
MKATTPALEHFLMEGLPMRTVLPKLVQIVRKPSAELACRTSSVDKADPWHQPFADIRVRSIAEANSITNYYYVYGYRAAFRRLKSMLHCREQPKALKTI